MSTWLETINMLELSAVKRPANRKRKLMQKKEWSTAYVNDLPDSAFLYIAPGGEKDSEGKTSPRSLRYFPVRDADGKIDSAHVRNALSRIPQAKVPSGVKEAAAAKARRLLEQINKSEENDMPPLWIPEKELDEFITKASLTKEQKAAIKEAAGALNKAGAGDMDDEGFGKLKATIAKLLGYGKTEKSVDDAVAEVKKTAEEAKSKVIVIAKSAIDKLSGEKPLINDVLTSLAELAEVKPVLKLEGLPPEVQAQIEAMRKSAEDDRAKMLELQKSIDEQKAKVAVGEFITKAEKELPDVPLASDDLGRLMHAVSKSENKDTIATLDKLLKSVQEIASKSELFRDVGVGGPITKDEAGVVARVTAMAQEMITKSEKPLSVAQAETLVFEQHPELYTEYLKATQL